MVPCVSYQHLLRLNDYESIAKAYYLEFHREMNWAQLYYLENYVPASALSLETLKTHAAQINKLEMERQFIKAYRAHGLSETDFLPEEQDIQVEQLCRYVDIPSHKHQFLELVCVLGGTCYHTIDDYTFQQRAGDFTIVPPGIRHQLRASEDCVCLTIKVRVSSFLENFSSILQDNTLISSYFTQVLKLSYYKCALIIHSGTDPFFQQTLLTIYSQQEAAKLHNERIMRYLWQALLTYLIQNYQDTAEFLVNNQNTQEHSIPIFTYLYENYQTITLGEIARHFNYSPPYMSAKIKEWTGKTFSQLLREYKLQKAAELLLQTNLKIDTICMEVGYADTVQFIRSFKNKYGQTPNCYRKNRHIAQPAKIEDIK